MRDDGCFVANVRTGNQDCTVILKFVDSAIQSFVNGIVFLVRCVSTADTVINVTGAKMCRQLRQKITFLDGRRG